MKIVINNLKGERNFKIFEIAVDLNQLISQLWNCHEDEHRFDIFHRNDQKARMSPHTAADKINELVQKSKDDDLNLEIKSIKHANAKHYLGLTLKGKRSGSHVQWSQVTIDQDIFLKHRKETTPNSLLMDILIQFKDESLANGTARTFSQAELPIITDPAKPKPTKKLPAEEQPKVENASLIMRVIKNPWFHGGLTTAVTAVGAYFARLSTLAIAGTSIGLGLAVAGIESFIVWRKRKTEEGYAEFSRMPDGAISRLDDPTKTALVLGLEAKAWGPWITSAFNTDAWKHYKAYGAGLKASQANDESLIAKINKNARPH